jgi:adenylosuccinate synthase
MINGVTDLIMTKPDVLTGFENINVCTHYQTSNGTIDYMPFDIVNEKIIPVYKTLRGWNENLTGIFTEQDLPTPLMNYISYLEKELHVPVSIISVGPDRKQTINRSKIVSEV